MVRLPVLLMLALSVVVVTAGDDDGVGNENAVDVVVDDHERALVNDVVEYVRNNGGYVHPNVEIRPIEGDDDENGNSATMTKLSGIFASRDLPAGTVVSRIPWHLILQTATPTQKTTDGDATIDNGGNDDDSRNIRWCDTVRTVHASITKPPDQQNPYEAYLSQRSRHYHPAFWSEAGKSMLKDLIGISNDDHGTDDEEHDDDNDNFHIPTLRFDRMAQDLLTESCAAVDGGDRDKLLDALHLVVTRAEGPESAHLIPFHDLINHRNGLNHANTEPIMHEGREYQLVTTRRVKAGEQLQNSYNRCRWCKIYSNPANEHSFITTPQLFEYYGLIEPYPQRWVVPTPIRLMFDVDEYRRVRFVVPPSPRGVAYLRRELERLGNFLRKYDDDDSVATVPRHERASIMQYHEVIATAFALAFDSVVVHRETYVSDEVWERGRYWYWEGDGNEEL